MDEMSVCRNRREAYVVRRGNHRVHTERRRAKNDVMLRRHERANDQLKYFVGAVSVNDFLHRHPVNRRDGAPESKAGAIRIPVHPHECIFRSFNGARARSECALIGSEFDDVGETALSSQLLNRLAADVRPKFLDLGGDRGLHAGGKPTQAGPFG